MQKQCGFILFLAGALLTIPVLVFGADPPMDHSRADPADRFFIYPQYSKKISMDFQDAPLTDVLKIFSQQSHLNFITAESLSNMRVSVYLDEVPVEEALSQILSANNLTYEIQPGTDIYIVKPLFRPDTEVETRVYPLKFATVSSSPLKRLPDIRREGGDEIIDVAGFEKQGITAAVRALLTPKGNLVEDPRTNSLIVTDVSTNFKNIEATIRRLDVATAQILIEVEMLEVSKETADKIGIKAGETPLSFTGAVRQHLYPWNMNQVIRKGFSFQDNSEYTAGTIDASGLTAILQFLRTQTDTKNLARPRILTLNNQPAEIKIATDEAIGAKTKTTSSQSTAEQSVEAERRQTGVFLKVTPQANPETGEIVMAVAPKVIVARTGGTFLGQTFKDPEERGTQSVLRVKSGETIVIGGLLREDTEKTLTKLPLLGDIPLLGALFRHKDSLNKERELIIFITPTIIDMGDGERKTVLRPDLPREQDIPFSVRRSVAMNRELSAMEKGTDPSTKSSEGAD